MSVKEDWRRKQTVSDDELEENWKLMFEDKDISMCKHSNDEIAPAKINTQFGWDLDKNTYANNRDEYTKMMAKYMEDSLIQREQEIIDYFAKHNLSTLVRTRDAMNKAIEAKQKDLGTNGENK